MIRKTSKHIHDRRLEITAFVTGVVILAFELTASRIVAPYLGSTIYTWTSIIGVILLALAVGYNYGGIWADRRKDSTDVIQLLIAAAIIIAVINIFKEALLGSVSGLRLPLQIQALFASLILFAVPTACLGAVMPYLARLNITDLATSGRQLSRVDAAGTIGSLVGTFLTGYVLFGFIGTRNLLTLFSVTLVLLTFLLSYRRYWWQRLALAVLLLLIGAGAPSPNLTGFVKEIDTAYNRVIIREIPYDDIGVRILQTDSLAFQSGVPADGRNELVIPYIRAFAAAADLLPDSKNHLIIGGGAFTFPEYLSGEFPAADVDTVEIDDKLANISEENFYFQPPANLKIIHADGRQYLNQNKKSYDMIFLDAFNSITPPFQLLTYQAVNRMEKSLKSNGVVAANFVSYLGKDNRQLIEAAYSTFSSRFEYVTAYAVAANPSADSLENVLLLASNQPLKDNSLKAYVGPKLKLHPRQDMVFRDDFAPVERYSL